MELAISKHTIEVERLIGERSAQALVRAETMVPGAGREAVEPLMEEATLAIGASEVQHDRVVLDGVVYCQAIYRQGDETSVRAITASATVNQVLDMPGVGPGMILKVDGQVEHAESAYENGHMVFNVVVGLNAQVVKLDNVELIDDLSGIEGLQTQYEEITSSNLSAESGAETLLREEVSLPGELDARMALMDFYSVRVKDTMPDLGGIRVRGEVLSETLIGTGVPGRPVALVKVTLPFDQLVELPEWLTQNVVSGASVRRMSTQVKEGEDGQDSTLTLECELATHVSATGQDKGRALRDAYATGKNGIEVAETELTMSGGQRQQSSVELFKGTLLLPEGAPGVGTVLAVRARPSLSEWNAQNGYTTLEGVMETEVLYLPSGSDRVNAVREEIPFSVRVDGELPPDAWVKLEASGAEAGALMSDRLEIRCSLKVESSHRRSNVARVVSNVTDTGPQQKREGIIMAWPGESDDLWTLGKKYRVSPAAISELNGLKEKLVPGKAIILRI